MYTQNRHQVCDWFANLKSLPLGILRLWCRHIGEFERGQNCWRRPWIIPSTQAIKKQTNPLPSGFHFQAVDQARHTKENRPDGVPRTQEERCRLKLVLRHQRMRRLRPPDLETNARLKRDRASAKASVRRINIIQDIDLQIDRPEIVTDQATNTAHLKVAAGCDTRTHWVAGVGRCLGYDEADRANRPLAELVEQREVSIEKITGRDLC
jgi:hypothetical protein